MRANKEIAFISLAMILLSVLIAIWIKAVYDKEVNTLKTQTNIEFLHALEETEKSIVFKKSKNPLSSNSIPNLLNDFDFKNSNDSVDSNQHDNMIIVRIKDDSIDAENRFNIKELLSSSVNNKDSSSSITISINKEFSEFSFGEKGSFNVDLDSAQATLKGLFSERLLSRDLKGLQFKVIKYGMDSNFHASFITDVGSVGNIFLDGGEYIAAIDLSPPIILKRMILELAFGLLLFLAIAWAFLFIYRSLEKERQLAILKDDFVSNMTHELKTPISIVTVAVEALSNFEVIKNKKKSTEYLNISKRELSRLDGLIDKLLNIGRETSTETTSSDLIVVNETIEEVVESMKTQQPKINMHVEKEGLSVFINIEDFKSIIYNILDNAIKYGPQDSPIEINVSSNNQNVIIAIKDGGKGISSEHQNNIFDKFYRIPTENIHNIKGHGLGLYNVKKHVKEAGGEVEIKSTKDNCTFIIRLPKAYAR